MNCCEQQLWTGMGIKKLSIFFIISFFFIGVFHAKQEKTRNLTGIYWGAFDPPTAAHAAIIIKSINDIPLKNLMIVVNNQKYKKYTYSLEIRLQMIKSIIEQHGLTKIELRWQDESHPIDLKALKKMIHEPLCAIAGYDAYKKWVANSSDDDRSGYDAIAVIPRGDDKPALFDKTAFILPIDSKYKDLSSTKVKNSLRSQMANSTCIDSGERNISTK